MESCLPKSTFGRAQEAMKWLVINIKIMITTIVFVMQKLVIELQNLVVLNGIKSLLMVTIYLRNKVYAAHIEYLQILQMKKQKMKVAGNLLILIMMLSLTGMT